MSSIFPNYYRLFYDYLSTDVLNEENLGLLICTLYVLLQRYVKQGRGKVIYNMLDWLYDIDIPKRHCLTSIYNSRITLPKTNWLVGNSN